MKGLWEDYSSVVQMLKHEAPNWVYNCDSGKIQEDGQASPGDVQWSLSGPTMTLNCKGLFPKSGGI